VVDFKARISAGKAADKFLRKFGYMKDVPRFTVQGMNQAEFVMHIFASGFMRGSAWKGEQKCGKE